MMQIDMNIFKFGNVNITEQFSGSFDNENEGLYSSELKLSLSEDDQNVDQINLNKRHAYAISDDLYEWHEAKRICEGLRGHLVVIDDEQENEYGTGNLFG